MARQKSTPEPVPAASKRRIIARDPIKADEIKILTAPLPTIKASARGGKNTYEEVFKAIQKMPEGSWFVVPGTEDAWQDDKAQARYFASKAAISKHLRNAKEMQLKSVEGVLLLTRADDGALLVRKTGVVFAGKPQATKLS